MYSTHALISRPIIDSYTILQYTSCFEYLPFCGPLIIEASDVQKIPSSLSQTQHFSLWLHTWIAVKINIIEKLLENLHVAIDLENGSDGHITLWHRTIFTGLIRVPYMYKETFLLSFIKIYMYQDLLNIYYERKKQPQSTCGFTSLKNSIVISYSSLFVPPLPL